MSTLLHATSCCRFFVAVHGFPAESGIQGVRVHENLNHFTNKANEKNVISKDKPVTGYGF